MARLFSNVQEICQVAYTLGTTWICFEASQLSHESSYQKRERSEPSSRINELLGFRALVVFIWKPVTLSANLMPLCPVRKPCKGE